MNSHRYINYKDLKTPRIIPTEIDYLAHIWLGLNNPDVSQSQLAQISSQLSFFPASALKEAKLSTNLTGLRAKLLTLKDARVFKEVLKRKYFPKSISDQEINLSSELDKINAPAELRAKVKDLIESKQTRSSNSTHVSRIQSTDSCTAQVINNPNINDGLMTDDKHSHLMADSKEVAALGQDEICSLLEGQSLQQIVKQFSPLISAVFHNLISSENWDTANLASKLGISNSDVEDLCAGNQSPATLQIFIRIIASIYWAMSHSAIFTGESKFLLPFNNGKAKLDFSQDAKTIKIFLPSDLKLTPFEMLKIDVNISIHVAQFIDFEQNIKNKDVQISTAITQPPWHNFDHLIIQNMSSNTVEWCKYDEVGVLNILTLSEQTYFVPEFKSQDIMNKLICLKDENKTRQDLELLVNMLTSHMSNIEKSQLPIGPAKTEMFRQCNMAGVDTKELKRTKSNFVQCNESIDALNRILFCQQMVKCNGQLSSAMIENLQESYPTYNKMKI